MGYFHTLSLAVLNGLGQLPFGAFKAPVACIQLACTCGGIHTMWAEPASSMDLASINDVSWVVSTPAHPLFTRSLLVLTHVTWWGCKG